MGDEIVHDLGLNAYQQAASSTAIYPGRYSFEGITYCALKLCGEAGEVAEKIGKLMRDENSIVSNEAREAILKEIGDVMWYLSQICEELDADFSTAGEMNQKKLASRLERGVLGGSGDDR